MQVKSYDGVKIYYHIRRKSSKFIVFLHGAGGDLAAWKKERAFFHKKGFSTIAIDLRGHGKSERPDLAINYKLENFAKDVHAVLKKERVRNFILVGHCFGGIITTIFHKLYPKPAKGYVLIDTTYKGPQYLKRLFGKSPFVTNLINKILERRKLRRKFKHVDFDKFIGTGDYDFRRIYSDIVNTSFKSWLFTYQQLAEFDGIRTLKQIKKPTLIVEGSKDSIFNMVVAKKIKSLVKGSKLSVIPKANHIVVINNPKELNEEIYEFLQQVKFTS